MRQDGRTQDQLAADSKIADGSRISKWVRGREEPRLGTIAPLFATLETDPMWILTGAGSPERKPDADLRLEVIGRVLGEDATVVQAMRDALEAEAVIEDLEAAEASDGGP